MAGTAGGMLVLPQLIRILLETYEFSGAILVLSGLALHAALGSTLLQPVKWWMSVKCFIGASDDNVFSLPLTGIWKRKSSTLNWLRATDTWKRWKKTKMMICPKWKLCCSSDHRLSENCARISLTSRLVRWTKELTDRHFPESCRTLGA